MAAVSLFGTPIWPPWRHVKTLYSNVPCQIWTRWSNFFSVCIEGYVKPICKPLRNAYEGAILQCLECQTTGNPGKPQDTQNVLELCLSNIFFTSSLLSFLQKNGKNWTQFPFVTEHEAMLMGSLHLVKQAWLWSLLSPISMDSWVVIPCSPHLIGAAITPV